MKAKLTIDGKEFEGEISEEQVQALTETKKKTGYERVERNDIYYSPYVDGEYGQMVETYLKFDANTYECANYYSDRTVAENNARADKLYRQLRRFAVEHRENKLDWNDHNDEKIFIYYNHNKSCLETSTLYTCQDYGNIYFDTYKNAHLAINTFKDELLWYFTEYKDSL